MTRSPIVPTLALLLACGTDEERFPAQFARDWCAASKACDEDAYFDAFPEGTPQCRDEVVVDIRSQPFDRDDRVCKWVQERGEACLERLRDATCEEVTDPLWYEGCISVYDCVTLLDR